MLLTERVQAFAEIAHRHITPILPPLASLAVAGKTDVLTPSRRVISSADGGLHMTKSDLVTAVYNSVGDFTRTEADAIVEAIIETIKETLASGEDVLISGFGKWSVRRKHPRPGRNPKTGEVMTISERKVVTFSPSQVLKKGLATN